MGIRTRTGWMVVAGVAALFAPLTVASTAQAVFTAGGDQGDPAKVAPKKGGFVLERTKVGPQVVGKVRNFATGRCLEESSTSSHVFTAPCDANNRWQNWQWVATWQGWNALQNATSGWCLDGTRATGRVYSHSCNSGQHQNWDYFEHTGEIIQHESLQYLDSNHEGSVYLSPRNHGPYQEWY